MEGDWGGGLCGQVGGSGVPLWRGGVQSSPAPSGSPLEFHQISDFLGEGHLQPISPQVRGVKCVPPGRAFLSLPLGGLCGPVTLCGGLSVWSSLRMPGKELPSPPPDGRWHSFCSGYL